MESKKLLATLLIVIALLASLEYLPRNILLKIAIPTDAPYPLNTAPSGTSLLWERLTERGYRTAIIYGASGLPNLANISDLVYLAVGGTLPDNASLREASVIIAQALKEGKRVHFILLDEAPRQPVEALAWNASQLICGSNPPRIIGILNSTISTFYGIAGDREYLLPTGFTGYITWSGDPLVYPAKPFLPQPINGYQVIAAAWPYPSQPYAGEWYAAGAECRSMKGSVVIIADSTIAVNLETGTVNESLEYLDTLIRERVNSPNTTLVVSDEELYVSPGSESLQLVLSLHPSVLLMAASKAYASLEKLSIQALDKIGLTPLLVAGLASILASSSIYSSLYGERRKRKASEKMKVRRLPALPFGGWRGAREACDMAVRRVEVLSPPEGLVGEEVERLRREIMSSCRRVKTANLLVRYIPLWGGVRRRVLEDLATVLSLAGVYDYVDAVRIVRGEENG